MKLNDITERKLLDEAFRCVREIESLLSFVDQKLAFKEKTAA
jgi:hypothetical protein